MKIFLSFYFALLAFSFSSIAQTKISESTKITYKLDEQAKVRDANGMEYPYHIWNKLMQTGKFGVQLFDKTNPDAPIFLIYELTEAEISARNDKMPKPRESGSFKDGDEFQLFNFRDTENNKFKSEDLAGKVIVLNFWFINCPPCRQEIPDLNDLVEQYKGKEVFFMALALDSWSDVDEFVDKTPFNYHIMPDSKFIAARYGVKSYPTHVVIDKSNKVIFQTSGLGINTIHWVKKSIDQALAGQ